MEPHLFLVEWVVDNNDVVVLHMKNFGRLRLLLENHVAEQGCQTSSSVQVVVCKLVAMTFEVVAVHVHSTAFHPKSCVRIARRYNSVVFVSVASHAPRVVEDDHPQNHHEIQAVTSLVDFRHLLDCK
jgi:hypothetical protein